MSLMIIDYRLLMLSGLNRYDFEARTFLPQTCLFTTPDPKAGDYPGLNPYLYCAANPLKYVDPTGKDYYTVNEYGFFELQKVTNDNFDRIYSSDYKTSIDIDKAIISSATEIRGIAKSETYGSYPVSLNLYKSTNNLNDLHDFLSRNTDVEWSLVTLADKNGDISQMIGTSHSESTDCSQSAILDIAVKNDLIFVSGVHNHSIPDSRPSLGDISVARKIQTIFPNAKLYIRYPYNNNKTLSYDRHSRPANELKEVVVTPK